LTLGYSFYFKQIVILDVLVLAGLYTVRIIAGSAAVAIWPSFWLLAFSQFLFLSLAMVKRYTELKGVVSGTQRFIKGRDYRVDDLELLTSLGGASGYLAVLVLALYINSNQVKTLYSHPEVIWLLCPLLLYWISRVWLLTHRGMMHDDPIVFALEDWASRFLFLAMAAILILAA
jgi:4-hydroxybenzoate polyprenyltransferase